MQNEPINEFPNLHWTKVPGDPSYFDQADFIRARFTRIATVAIVALLLIPIACYWVVSGAKLPNPVQVYSDGRLFSGPLRSDLTIPDSVVVNQMEDTLEVLLTRTEKGGVPGLRYFVGPGILEYVDSLYEESTKLSSGFSQSYTITDTRFLAVEHSWVVLGVRGLLSSRTIDGYQPAEIFWIVGYSRTKGDDVNPLGWRLARLVPDPSGELFYNEEIARQRAIRLGIEQETSPAVKN